MARKPRPAPIYSKQDGSYRLHFCYNGKQYRRFYIKDESIANALQGEVNQAINLFRNGMITLPERMSLDDFIFAVARRPDPVVEDPRPAMTRLSQQIAAYRQNLVPPIKAQSTCKTERIHLAHLDKFIQVNGDCSLAELNVGFFNAYKQFRYRQGIRTDTVNKELGTFHALLQLAVENRDLDHNIISKVKRDKSQVPADRFRTSEEIVGLLARSEHYTPQEIKEIKRFRYLAPQEIQEMIELARGKWFQPILITYAYTGMRRGELVKLQWADVDLTRGLLWIRSQKQSRRQRESHRCVYLHEVLWQTLSQQKQRNPDSRWVFTNAAGQQLSVHTLSDLIQRLTRGTKFEGIGYHTLRHSLASNMAAAGVDQRIIDRTLGHQTQAMRKRYQHLFPKQMRQAIDQIGY